MNKENLIFYTICLLFIATIYYVFNIENFEQETVLVKDVLTDNDIIDINSVIKSESIYKKTDISYLIPNVSEQKEISQDDPILEADANIIVHDRNTDIDSTVENIPVQSINNDLNCDDKYEKIDGLNSCIEKCPDGYISMNNKCIKRDLYEPSIINSNQITKCNRNEVENNNNECVSCPRDYIISSDKNYCIKNTITEPYNGKCSSDSTYFKNINKCVSLNEIKEPFIFPKNTKYECLENQILINDKCYSCNDKDILNNEQKCVKETSIERNKKELKCPDDYIYDISNNKCIKYICPENYILSNDKCFKFNCISGYTFDSTIKKCINNNKCENDYIYDNGLCKQYTCEPNFTFDIISKKCKANSLEGECLKGTYNTETKKCEHCNGTIVDGKCYNKQCNENTIIDDKCYVCNNNSTLYKVGEEYKCISCPEGYTYDINNNICVSDSKYCNNKITTDNMCTYKQCNDKNTRDGKCYNCLGEVHKDEDGKYKCYKCEAGYYLNKNLKCVKN